MKTSMKLASAALLLVLAAPAGAEELFIKGAKVHTMGPAGTLAAGNVLVRDGIVVAVGANVAATPGAKVVDATGLVVTPGLIAAHTALGLREVDGVEESADDAADDKRFSANLDVVDGLNPRSVSIAVARIEGVTQAVAAPSVGKRDGLLAGYGAVVNLGSPERFVTRPRAAMYLQAGERGAQLIGGSRPAALAWLREVFEETRNPKLWQGRPNREALLSPLEVEAIKPVLAGQVPLVASADRASDLRALMKLSADYKFRLIVLGGAEAHLVARELARQNVPVILDPTGNLPARFEALAATDANAMKLQAAGVTIAFMADDQASQNARNLRQLAGNAVARGLSWDAALAAITVNPARIFGIERERGSIAAGKAADLVIWDGDPLELQTWPRAVYADGKLVPPVSRQTLLRDRYLKRARP